MLIQHLANNQALSFPTVYTPATVLLQPGDANVFVENTSRFRINDEVLICTATATGDQLAEPTKIIEIPAYNQLVISPTSIRTGGWTVAENPYIIKAVQYQPLKNVLIGDIRVIPSFPTITIAPNSANYNWLTLRGTDHESKMTIRVYVQGDGTEASEELLSRLVVQVQEILIDHFHLIVDGTPYGLTANLISGSSVVSISDTTGWQPGDAVIIRDATKQSQFCVIESVLSPTMLELRTGSENDYFVSREAEIIKLNKYLYETAASEINYGYVPGSNGSFLRAAEITYMGKEFVCRNNPDIQT